MAQLLLISEFTKIDSNNIGDIVDIFDDDHEFSPAEIDGFTIYQTDKTIDEITEIFESFDPQLPPDSQTCAERIAAIQSLKGLKGIPLPPALTYQFRVLDVNNPDLTDNVAYNLEG